MIITAGGALLGFVAGEMAVSDPALGGWTGASFQMTDKKPVLAGVSLEILVGLTGAALVVAIGKWLARRHAAVVGEAQEFRDRCFPAVLIFDSDQCRQPALKRYAVAATRSST